MVLLYPKNSQLLKIIVPGTLIEEAEHQWAPREDPVFELVPADCKQYISLAYAKLGSPEVNFYLFWQVYNQLRDAVDPDFWTTTDSHVSDGENMSEGEGADTDELPLNHLRPCVLGENGVPAAISKYSDGESGMPADATKDHSTTGLTVTLIFQNLLWQ